MSTAAQPSPDAAGRDSSPGWQRAALFGAGYFACAEASRFLSVPDSTYISFWLPSGLYVAVLLLNDRAAWPSLILGAFAANLAFDLLYGTPALAALCFSLTNAVQSVASALLVRRFVAERPSLATLRELLGFLACAAVLGNMVGAALGAATLAGFGLSGSFVQSWKVWWGSNAMAMLLLSPFILTWFSGAGPDRRQYLRPEKALEAGLLLLVLGAFIWHLLTVGGGIMAPDKGRIVLPLLWAGLRFGARGAALANILLAVPVAFFVTQFHAGLTPAQTASAEYVFVMQVALAVAALVALIPAVVVEERDRKMRELSETTTRLQLAVQASNIGLWDWNIVTGAVYFSPEWKRQLGYRDDEIDHRSGEWESRLHPEDRARVLTRLRDCLKDPAVSYEAEFRLRHKDGSYRWVHAQGVILRDAEGLPERMLGCHIDITDRRRVQDELRSAAERLRELTRRLVEVEEAERRNINRELHDRVGQNLSALSLSLNLVGSRLPPSMPAEIGERLADARALAESTVRQVRDVMAELHPPALDDYGLLAALRTYAEPFSARLGVPVAIHGAEPAPRLPPATETALFRIAQEALTNAAKHARAAHLEITLASRNGNVALTLSDDGVGFHVNPERTERVSWGLRTMRERAEAVGATLRVESRPGRGTQVVVEVAGEAA